MGHIVNLISYKKYYTWFDVKFTCKHTKKQFKTDNVISDNRSSFVAIETNHFASSLYIKRHFELALAPWQGFFERLVGSVKEFLSKDLQNYKITFDELQSIFLGIEPIINNSPLTHIYTDSIKVPLTPSKLVFPRNLIHWSLSELPVNVEVDIYDHRENIISNSNMTNLREYHN